MEPVLTQVLGFLVPVVEACGALVVVMGAARTIVRYVLNYFRRDSVDVRTLRICLGQSMVMGLEFQVAADILKTALSPEWTDILFLAALIGLRTVLNFLLERELQILDSRRKE